MAMAMAMATTATAVSPMHPVSSACVARRLGRVHRRVSGPVRRTAVRASGGNANPGKRVVVLGGNGFVGSAVCRALLDSGFEVASLNRSGPPQARADAKSGFTDEALRDKVEWISGDVFDEASAGAAFRGAWAVVSCIGGFGSNEQMLKVCGEATSVAARSAKDAGARRFGFVSVHDYKLPAFISDGVGYFKGKAAAERSVLDAFPEGGFILRPGFIYGTRLVNGLAVPLDAVGAPVERLTRGGPLAGLRKLGLPLSELALAPPVAVESVAKAVASCLEAQDAPGGRILALDDIAAM